jgi:hypothetical protein
LPTLDKESQKQIEFLLASFSQAAMLNYDQIDAFEDFLDKWGYLLNKRLKERN